LRPFGLPPLALNLDVLSIFNDQSQFVLNPWRALYPREYSWDPVHPLATRAYSGPPADVITRVQDEPIRTTVVFLPLPPQRNLELWDWLLHSRSSRLRDFHVRPVRHHCEYWPCLPGRIPETLPHSWTYAETAHQLFVSQILASWFRSQVLGPRDMPLVIIWNARTRNDTFNNHDLAYEVSARLDDLLAAISLAEEDPTREARGVLRKMVRASLTFPLGVSSESGFRIVVLRAAFILVVSSRCIGRLLAAFLRPSR
jgi:hypothetical protein